MESANGSSASAPVAPRPLVTVPPGVAVRIGQQATALSEWTASAALLSRRAAAISAILNLLGSTTGCHCSVVGSLASGLDTDTSDIDVVVRLASAPTHLFGARLPFISPVLTAVAGTDILSLQTNCKKQKEAIRDAFDAHGFRVEYRPNGPLLRMFHHATQLPIDVWCDPAASPAQESLAEMRAAATRNLVQQHPLVRILHCVLRRAAGAELRGCESYQLEGQPGIGSYVVLLLVHRWVTTQSDPTHCEHDGGAKTATTLLALLDHLVSLRELDEVVLLREPPPISELPGLAPLRLNLERICRHQFWMSKSKKKFELGRDSASFGSLTTMAEMLGRALRRGIPLDELVTVGSSARRDLILSIRASLPKRYDKHIRTIAHDVYTATVDGDGPGEAAVAEARALAARATTLGFATLSELDAALPDLSVKGGEEADAMSEASCFTAASRAASDTSYFTNRWLPSDLISDDHNRSARSAVIGDREARSASATGSSFTLNRNAPTFMPGARVRVAGPDAL